MNRNLYHITRHTAMIFFGHTVIVRVVPLILTKSISTVKTQKKNKWYFCLHIQQKHTD